MLRAIGGNSEYLVRTRVLREPETLLACRARRPDAAVDHAFARLGTNVRPAASAAAIGAAMREAKRQVALAVALGDIGGAWPLSRVTGALSRLAEETLQLGLRHLLLQAHARGSIACPSPDSDPVAGSGLIILALGKLGGRELNYSSDIDLIVFYRSGSHCLSGRDYRRNLHAPSQGSGQAHGSSRERGGYVFRVDLRLRPDPSAMPLAISVPTALTYYETVGRNWERAAYHQGAAGRRRYRARRQPFSNRCGPSSGAVISISPPSPISTR